MTKIIGEPEPWPQTIPEEIAQQYSDTCAVKSQQIIMKTFGVDIPEDQLAMESYIKGYYAPGVGSDPDLVGKLLNDHGIGTHSANNASVYDLVTELAQGHKVIVGVDSGELWHPTWYNDIFGEAADHALVVTGIDTSDPENVKVIITDPGTGDVAKEYPLDQFMDAWHDSSCFYVATNEPAPAGTPEMSGFDFNMGHIPFICNIPYESYVPIAEQYGIFHDDIIKNMNECINNLNGENHTYDFHEAFAHIQKVEGLMQDGWSHTDWADTLHNNAIDINANLLNDHWDWNTFDSDLPTDLTEFM